MPDTPTLVPNPFQRDKPVASETGDLSNPFQRDKPRDPTTERDRGLSGALSDFEAVMGDGVQPDTKLEILERLGWTPDYPSLDKLMAARGFGGGGTRQAIANARNSERGKAASRESMLELADASFATTFPQITTEADGHLVRDQMDVRDARELVRGVIDARHKVRDAFRQEFPDAESQERALERDPVHSGMAAILDEVDPLGTEVVTVPMAKQILALVKDSDSSVFDHSRQTLKDMNSIEALSGIIPGFEPFHDVSDQTRFDMQREVEERDFKGKLGHSILSLAPAVINIGLMSRAMRAGAMRAGFGPARAGVLANATAMGMFSDSEGGSFAEGAAFGLIAPALAVRARALLSRAPARIQSAAAESIAFVGAGSAIHGFTPDQALIDGLIGAAMGGVTGKASLVARLGKAQRKHGQAKTQQQRDSASAEYRSVVDEIRASSSEVRAKGKVGEGTAQASERAKAGVVDAKPETAPAEAPTEVPAEPGRVNPQKLAFDPPADLAQSPAAEARFRAELKNAPRKALQAEAARVGVPEGGLKSTIVGRLVEAHKAAGTRAAGEKVETPDLDHLEVSRRIDKALNEEGVSQDQAAALRELRESNVAGRLGVEQSLNRLDEIVRVADAAKSVEPIQPRSVSIEGARARESATEAVPAQTPRPATEPAVARATPAQAALRAAVKRGAQPAEVQELRDRLVEEQSAVAEVKVPSDPMLPEVMGRPKQADPAKDFALEPTPTPEFKGEPVGTQEVMKSLSAVADIPIRIGRVRGTKSAGEFLTKPEVARIRSADDIPTMAFEVGRAISKSALQHAGASGAWAKTLGGSVRNDLLKAGRDVYGNRNPSGGYVESGFAELVRLKTLNPEAMRTRYPNASKWFEGKFLADNPELAKRLEAAGASAAQYRTQGAENFSEANMVLGRAGQSAWSKVREFLGKRSWVDSFEPLRVLSEAATVKRGRALPAAEDPFKIASAERLADSALVGEWIEHGMTDIARNRVGPALNDAYAIVQKMGKGQMLNFRKYRWAKHALDMHAEGKNPGIPKDLAEQLVRAHEGPEFQQASAMIRQWKDGVLSYAQEAGLYTAQDVSKIRKWDNHVPLQRVFDDVAGLGKAQSASDPIRRLGGSGRRIRDPFASEIEQALNIKRAADRHRILRAVRDLGDAPGLGEFVEGPLPKDMVPKNVQMEQVRAQLEKAGADLSGVSSDLSLSYFEAMKTPKGTEPIVPIRGPSGKTEWFRVQEPMWRMMEGLDVYRLPKWLDVFLGAPKRTFTLGTTGLSASFSLVRNTMRDTLEMLVKTKGSVREAVPNIVKSAADAALGFGGKDTHYSDLYNRLGVKMSQPLGVDAATTRKVVKSLGVKGGSKVVRDPIHFLRELFQVTEAIPRIAELRASAKRVGYEPGQPMTESQAIQMTMDSKRITTDFSAAGDMSRLVNSFAPFFNPQIQGLRTTVRVAKRDRLRFVARGVSLLTLPTLTYWWNNKDEGWYRDMPDREKFSYWHLRVGDGMVHVPRPHDIGHIFATMPEALFDSMYREDPEAIKQAFGHIFENSTPNPTPVIAQILKEQLANRVDFSGAPVDPRSEQRLPAAERAGPYTTRLAKFLGDKLKMSPRRIDHVMRGLFGGLATDVPKAVGLGADGRDRESELTDLPVVGTLFRRGGVEGVGSKALNTLYGRLDEVRERGASTRHTETKAEADERRSVEDAIRAVTALRSIQREQTTLRERQMIQREIRLLAKDALANASSRSFLSMRRRAERRAKRANAAAGR